MTDNLNYSSEIEAYKNDKGKCTNISIDDICSYLDKVKIEYDFYGDKHFIIEGFCPVSNLRNNAITWIRDIKKIDLDNLNYELNLLFIADDEKLLLKNNFHLINCKNPKAVFLKFLKNFFIKNLYPPYVLIQLF